MGKELPGVKRLPNYQAYENEEEFITYELLFILVETLVRAMMKETSHVQCMCLLRGEVAFFLVKLIKKYK